MKTLRSCHHFNRLVDDARDRELTGQEIQFLDSHRSSCEACRIAESLAAYGLDLLRHNPIEAECSDRFTEQVLRKHRIASSRRSIRYWYPLVAGAAVAGLAAFAMVQIMAGEPAMKTGFFPFSQARNDQAQSFHLPKLDFASFKR